jgi:hypothetical protein
MTRKAVALVLEPLTLTRVVSTAASLDALTFAPGTPEDTIILRTAPDEAMILDAVPASVVVDDQHAIIVEDSGWCGAWLPTDVAEQFLLQNATWHLPPERPLFAQGMVAEAPVKVWAETQRVLLVVPRVAAQDFQSRMEL